MKYMRLALIFSALAIGSGGVAAQPSSYPNKPVTLVVPVGVGSSTDIIARFFGEQLSKRLNQAFVVEPTPGAGGTLGVQKLLSRPADGYNVLMGTSATSAANFSLYKTLPYSASDLAPVACMYTMPTVIVIRGDLPVKNLAEFVAYAKANPGVLNYGAGSSTAKIGAELFKARTGTNIREIPYKAPQQVFTDLMGGRIDMAAESAVATLPFTQRGALRILAVLSPTRASSMPDIPTMEELGFPKTSLAPWVGIFVKSGTPPEIVNKLNAAFGAVLASPEYAAFAENTAKSQSFICTPQELGQFAQAETVKWRELIKLAGIEPE